MATPWQKVFSKFNCSQAEFARQINRNRSKVSRALSDPYGLISSTDIGLIMKAAASRNVDLSLDDFRPDHG